MIGLKENVIIGKLIPAGTGMDRYRNIKLDSDLNEEEELFQADAFSDDEDADALGADEKASDEDPEKAEGFEDSSVDADDVSESVDHNGIGYIDEDTEYRDLEQEAESENASEVDFEESEAGDNSGASVMAAMTK